MDLYAQICTDIDGKKFISHDIWSYKMQIYKLIWTYTYLLISVHIVYICLYHVYILFI
jgi:hypothetical protein